MTKINKPLTKTTFRLALDILKRRDPDIHDILSRIGPPPFWQRKPGFPTLIRIILEQQVSLASARAAFQRLQQILHVLTPQTFLTIDPAVLRQAGFSRQKTRYSRILAEAILDGSLSLTRLNNLEDDQVRAELLKIKGIGPWTANIYLLMALRRPDIWPMNDMALVVAIQKVKKLAHRPSPGDLDKLSQTWAPWRAVAARVFWHHYLDGKGPTGF